jgi:hypothetical protein
MLAFGAAKGAIFNELGVRRDAAWAGTSLALMREGA